MTTTTTTTASQFLLDRLSRPPFSRQLTRLQLAGESSAGSESLSLFGLMSLLHDCIVHIDSVNPMSVHRAIQLRAETPADTAERVTDYMRLMRFRPGAASASNAASGDNADIRQRLLAGDRALILEMMEHLLRREDDLRKRAYLAPLLTPLDVPQDFMADEVIANLCRQVTQLQSQFKTVHKAHEEWREHCDTRFEIKKEMKQMEEEKSQLLSRTHRLQRKVEHLPDHQVWVEAARKLRLEQAQELDLKQRLKDTVQAQAALDQKILQAQLRFRDVKSGFVATPENMIQKLKDDVKVNKYLIKDKLQKTIEEKTVAKGGMGAVRQLKAVDAELIRQTEAKVAEHNSTIARLSQQKMKAAGPIDDRLTIFRQQAAMIASKRDTAAAKLQKLLDEYKLAQSKLATKRQDMADNEVPSGEQFKKFAGDLRSRAIVYKEKKRELSQQNAQNVILERTIESLKTRVLELKAVAERQGKTIDTNSLRGNTQLNEDKREMTADELAVELEKLNRIIEDEKTELGPQVKQVRMMRDTVQDLEHRYKEKKKHYEAIMMGIDVENAEQEKRLQQAFAELSDLESAFFVTQATLETANATEERVNLEMKSYIGGDDYVAALQSKRGFKTYRELYTKKIAELEAQNRSLREQQKDNNANQALQQVTKMQQREIFLDVKSMLEAKLTLLKQLQTVAGPSTQPSLSAPSVGQMNKLVL